MKDTIIPAAIVGILFVIILLGAGVWVFTHGSNDAQVTAAQQQAADMLQNMDNNQTATGETQPAGESYEITPGLLAQDVQEGSGEPVKAGQTVAVKYEGKLQDGTVFDASDRHPDENGGFTFPLGGGMVIKGWDLGVAGMKPGGVRILTVSPELGYGAQGAGGVIPPNATLTFRVELIGPVNQ